MSCDCRNCCLYDDCCLYDEEGYDPRQTSFEFSYPQDSSEWTQLRLPGVVVQYEGGISGLFSRKISDLQDGFARLVNKPFSWAAPAWEDLPLGGGPLDSDDDQVWEHQEYPASIVISR